MPQHTQNEPDLSPFDSGSLNLVACVLRMPALELIATTPDAEEYQDTMSSLDALASTVALADATKQQPLTSSEALAVLFAHVDLATRRLAKSGSEETGRCRPVGVDPCSSSFDGLLELLGTHGSAEALSKASAKLERMTVATLLRLLRLNFECLESAEALTDTTRTRLYGQLREYLYLDLGAHPECISVSNAAASALAAGSNALMQVTNSRFPQFV